MVARWLFVVVGIAIAAALAAADESAVSVDASAVVAEASPSASGSPRHVVALEQSFGLGGAWVPRCVVELELVEEDGARPKWRATARDAGVLSPAELAPAVAALAGDSFFRVRACGAWGGCSDASSYVVGATRMVRAAAVCCVTRGGGAAAGARGGGLQPAL